VFQLDLDSFCDLINEWIHGMLLINSLKRSKRIEINEHRVCCYEAVSVNSQTFVTLPFVLFYLFYVLSFNFKNPISKPFWN
jgi:hypothetical protein